MSPLAQTHSCLPTSPHQTQFKSNKPSKTQPNLRTSLENPKMCYKQIHKYTVCSHGEFHSIRRCQWRDCDGPGREEVHVPVPGRCQQCEWAAKNISSSTPRQSGIRR
ncbi:uncharacterized protein RAG0_16057 [Rhynchosporium agropyri]|uniref:Uncharacterized protein n=1 Tax=Rhynchosporium agropyri TaxID=914238 RepID=A0A1E1LNQ5_9HELO|nr:uncharacterized protein RAG0_16057 [Rhynchosporium agropyri]